MLATARNATARSSGRRMSRRPCASALPEKVIKSIKFREPTATIEASFGTVVEVIREAFTERSVSAATYNASVSLFGVPRLVDLITLAGAYAGGAALLTVFNMRLDPGETHLLPSLD